MRGWSGVKLSLIHIWLAVSQALSTERKLSLRRLQGAGQGELPLHLSLQAGPELPQARQRQLQLTAQALIQRALAADPVVAQAYQEPLQLPLLSTTCALHLQLRRLATQAAIEIDIGLRLQRTSVEATRGVQRAGQISRHFRQPVTGVERTELQHGLDVYKRQA